MQGSNLQRIFFESASEVLEAMFFAGVTEEVSQPVGNALISAELTFHGNPAGRFGIQIAHATGRVIAASFLGLDEAEVSEEQIVDVVCELTNMICGSVLSRVEAGARFELMHPEIDSRNADWRLAKNAVGATFGVEDGSVTLWMIFDEIEPALVA
jgi:CheY-specific phosphatase CheX